MRDVMDGTYRCIFCWEPEAMEVKYDKKGRPYIRCALCGVRAFIHSPRSYFGLKLVSNISLNNVRALKSEVPEAVEAFRRNKSVPRPE